MTQVEYSFGQEVYIKNIDMVGKVCGVWNGKRGEVFYIVNTKKGLVDRLTIRDIEKVK